MAGFMKHDQAKPPVVLLPAEALLLVAEVMGYGAGKYAAYNWTQCQEPERLVSAALRHIIAQMKDWEEKGEVRGMHLDEESGFASLAHAGASILMALSVLARQQRVATPDSDGESETPEA